MKLSNQQKNFLRSIGLQFASFLVNVLLSTVKIKIKNRQTVELLYGKKQNFVSAFWHGSMLSGWYIHRDKNFAALVSKSKDGDVLSQILKSWKYNVVRGSSHVGGKEALDLLINLVSQNFNLAITPDGPTGPIYKMKAGAVVTAKKCNVPLVLTGIGCKNKFVLKSWDKFEIPKPFAEVNVIYSEPIYINENLSYEETSIKIQECENLLNQLQKEALESCST